MDTADLPIDALRTALRQMLDAAHHTQRDHLLHETLTGPRDGFWRHATLVALHATQLARCIGLGGDLLHELALGALLHDIGVLERTPDGNLEPRWHDHGQSHPTAGLLALAERPDVPVLCLLIAQQHHRHVGGHGNSGFPSSAAQVNLATRIIAVADAWACLVNTAATLPDTSREALCRRTMLAMAEQELDADIVHLLLEQVPRSAPATQSEAAL